MWSLLPSGKDEGYFNRHTDIYIYMYVITNCQVEDAVRANNSESDPVEEGVIVKEGFSVEMTF